LVSDLLRQQSAVSADRSAKLAELRGPDAKRAYESGKLAKQRSADATSKDAEETGEQRSF